MQEPSTEPFIEATIINGKVYWRSVAPDSKKILLTGQRSKKSAEFEYNAATCFRMPCSDFQVFKNSGKRTENHDAPRTRPFDVATREQLNSLGKNNHELDHVHIPSLNKLTSKKKIHKKISKQWGAMAIPKTLHSKVWCQPIITPFCDEIRFYLQSADEASHLLLLGAFRNLLRLHMKKRDEESESIPFLFFKTRPDLVKKIDALLHKEITQLYPAIR